MKIFLEILGIVAVTLGPVWIVAGLWIAALSRPDQEPQSKQEVN